MKPPCFKDPEAKKEIQRLCKEQSIDLLLLEDLCEAVADYAGSGRKEGIISDISECIDRFLTRSESRTGE